MKRFLSLILTVVMVMSMVPASFASEYDGIIFADQGNVVFLDGADDAFVQSGEAPVEFSDGVTFEDVQEMPVSFEEIPFEEVLEPEDPEGQEPELPLGDLTLEPEGDLQEDLPAGEPSVEEETPAEEEIPAEETEVGLQNTAELIQMLSVYEGDVEAVAETIVSVNSEDALRKALKAGGSIRLTKDIWAKATLVVPPDAVVTLDLNGYKLVRGGDLASNYALLGNLGTLTIKDTSASAAGYIGGNITNGYSGTSNSNSGYASKYNTAAVLNVQSGTLSIHDYNPGNNQNAISNYGIVNIEGGTFNFYNNRTVLTNYNTMDISAGSINGAIVNTNSTSPATTAELNITGGSFTNNSSADYNVSNAAVSITGGIFSGNKAQTFANGVLEGSNYKLDENGKVVPVVAYIGETGYTSLQEALNVGGEIVLVQDIVLTEPAATMSLRSVALAETLVVPSGVAVTLNMNGHTISQTKVCTGHYEMIRNNGSLTITGNGKISFTDTGAGDPSFGWGSYTIGNSGALTVENGTIENLSQQNQGSVNHMYCAIQQSAGSTTINGGTISNPTYRSVRVNKGSLTINGGTFKGQVWLQPNQGDATLAITGGTFAPTGVDGSSVFMTNAGENYTVASAAISGGTFTTKIGASEPAKLSGSITGGTFTAAAASGTYAALLGDMQFSEADANGNYSVVAPVYAAYIDAQGYASLQAAIDAVQNGETIALAADCAETVTVNKSNVAFTIDGQNVTCTGVIKIGVGQTLTVKNVNFVDNTDADVNFIMNEGSPTGKNYNTTLKVENCSFTGSGNGGDVAVRMTHPTHVEIISSTATGLHSMMQNTGGQKVTVDGVTITNSKSGLSLGGVREASVRNSTIAVSDAGYGVRIDAATENAKHTVESCEISAFIPVVVRKASAKNVTLTVDGANTMTATNTDGLWCAIGSNEYETSGTLPTAATGQVIVTVNDSGLNVDGVYGAYEWPVEVVFSDGHIKGFDSLSSAMNYGYSGGAREQIIVHKDITESMSSLKGNIVTDNPNGVTIKNTIVDEWIYCGENFTIGKGVTYDATGYNSGLFMYANDAVINGTVITDCYYQRYADTKLTINEPGSMTVKTETFILRYTEGDKDAGVYIVGDNDASTIGLNAAVIYFYQGMINAKDANIQVGTYWQTQGTDNQGSANLVLDNSEMNVTVNEHDFKATGNSTVTLTNGSVVNAAGGYEGVGVYLDETSSFNVAKTGKFVAKNNNIYYTALSAALDAANDGDTIILVWAEGDAPIAMNGAVYGKAVTITGTATVDWSKGNLFIGRGGAGNGTVIFDNANLTSASNNASYGIHVSGREKDTNNKYDGTLKIKNSTIELDYLINKGTMTLDASALTVKNGFSIGGRPASETESGEDATATLNLTNGSKVVVNNHNGMGLGYEAIGVMNIDDTSAFETTQCVLVTATGTMNVAGTATIAGTLTNNGSIALTNAAATLTASECGNVTTTVEGCFVEYYNGAYRVAKPVARVGNVEYTTIDEAIANWTNGTTLTLLADVTLSDVITLKSTEHHILDLGTFTMTAASKKDAIQIENCGRTSASYALDIKADAANPGGITAAGKTIVVTTGKSSVQDRPIIRFYNGVFNASYIVKHSGSNGTYCPQFQFHGGEYTGTISTNRTLNQFYGGTFHGSLFMSVDSSAYTLVAGGTFKQLSNSYNSTLNSSKFTIGSAKGVYDRVVYVNDDGYYVVAAAEHAEGYEASVAKTPGTNDYLKYSSVAADGKLNYTDVYAALANNKSAAVSVYVDELDLTGTAYKGTLIIEDELTVTFAEGTAPAWKVDTEQEGKVVGYTESVADGVVTRVYSVFAPVASIGEVQYPSLQAAINAAQNGDTVTLLQDINLAETITVNNGEAVILDLNGKTISGACNAGQAHMFMVENTAELTIKDSSTNGKITYAGNNSTGWIVDVEGALVLESGTLELTGSWSIGYAVDVRPNAWGTAYTAPTTFVMNGGAIISSDGGVRVASSSSDSYSGVSESFTMNGGSIDAAWDGVFVQQSNAAWDVLSFTMNGGKIESDLNPIRLYGPAASSYVNGEDCMTINLNGGNLAYTGAEVREWLVEEVIRTGGGATVDAFVADTAITASAAFANTQVAYGYKWMANENGAYTLTKADYVANVSDGEGNAVGYETLAEAFAAAKDGETITLLTDLAIDSETYTIADGVSITLDMNGKKLTVTDNKTSNYELFYIYGGMTVTGNGAIELASTNNRAWNAMSAIFHNRGGELTIENGTYKNLGGTDMAWVVDNSGNYYGDATTTIKGGALDSTYTAIRNRMEQNSHGASGKAILNITGGAITGTTSAIWAQAASTSATAPATGEINISGGEIGLINTARSAGAVSMTTITGGTVAGFKGEVEELTVKGGSITGSVSIRTAGDVEIPYAVTAEGLYVAAVAKIGDTNYATLTAALKAATSGCTITLLADVTIDEYWDARYTGAKFTVPVTIDGNNKTIKFTNTVYDAGNYMAAFRFEADATVKNLTIDMSEALSGFGTRIRAISAKANLTVDGCTFIGNGAENNTRAIIFGEGAGAAVGDVEVKVTNSTFRDWKRGLSDNENSQDVKSVIATGNTFTNAGVNISAKEAITFTGNTVSGAYVKLTSYTAVDTAKVIATGNTLQANTTANFNSSDVNNESCDIQPEFLTSVAKIGSKLYFSLAAAISAAAAGDTIELLADVTEDVTISKDLTIDGANKAYTYTGNIKVSGAVDVTLQNIAFVKGYIEHSSSNTTGNLVVKGCSFANGGYAVTTARINSVTIEDCTVQSQSLLYAKLSTNDVVVRNVTIDSGNYVAHLVYGSTALFENVTATNMTGYGICTQNYGAKTITLKNCSFNAPNYYALAVRDDRTTAADTFIFEGNNSMSSLYASDYAKYLLGAADATLAALADANVESGVEGYMVIFEDDVYKLVKKATIGHGLQTVVRGEKGDDNYRESVTTTLENVYAKESLVVKLYSGATLLGTTTLKEYEDDDASRPLYPVNSGEITVNNVISGVASGSWNTVWEANLTQDNIPTRIELYADGELMDTYENNAGAFLNEEEKSEYLALFEKELFDIYMTNMRFGNDLSLLFAFKKEDVADTNGYVVITAEDGDAVTIPFAELDEYTINGYDCYAATYNGLAAKQMVDTVTVTVFDSDDNAVSNEYSESIRSYAMRRLENSTNAEFKTLIVDMLNYGAIAQIKFSYRTNDLANALLTDGQKQLASAAKEIESILEKDDTYYVATNARFETTINMLFMLQNVEQSMNAEITFNDHYGKAKSLKISGNEFDPGYATGKYVIEFDALVVADARQVVTCTIKDSDGNVVTTIKDSLASYAKRNIEKDDIYEAFMKFADSAYAYMH